MPKHLPILGFLLLVALPLAAQRTAAPPLPPVDTTYFDRDWERTTLPEDRAFARLARHSADGKPVGTVRDYFYPSWKKQWEGKLVQENPDWMQGLCTGWFENGRVHFRGTYVQGQPQADFQRWAADGHLVKCRYTYHDALPVSKGKLHSQYNNGSSRQVFPVDLPLNTVGVVYRLDIRDEGQPVTWSTVLALGAAYANPSATMFSLLTSGSRALASQAVPPVTGASTQCHWYIVPDQEAAQEFIQTKGRITNKPCYRQATNVTAETRELKVTPGTRRLYICVNNNNSMTAATATVSVSALVEKCQ
jgi:hypothetical protein